MQRMSIKHSGIKHEPARFTNHLRANSTRLDSNLYYELPHMHIPTCKLMAENDSGRFFWRRRRPEVDDDENIDSERTLLHHMTTGK